MRRLSGCAESAPAAKVGANKDSEKRHRDALQGFARRAGYGIVDEFYDAAVSGADAIDARPGFTPCVATGRRAGALLGEGEHSVAVYLPTRIGLLSDRCRAI